MRHSHSVIIAASCVAAIASSPYARAETPEEANAKHLVSATIWATNCGVTLGPQTASALQGADDLLHLTNDAPATAAMTTSAMQEFNKLSEQEKLERCFTLSMAFSK